jgi:hypothetical protein
MGQLGAAQAAYQRAARIGRSQAAGNLSRVNGRIAVANAKASGPTPGGTDSYFDPAQIRLHEDNCRTLGRDDQSSRSASGC